MPKKEKKNIKKQPKKQNIDPKKKSLNKEITYIAVIVVLALLALCLYLSPKMGMAGKLTKAFMTGMFGIGGYILPVYALAAVVILLVKKNFKEYKGKYIASIVLFICILAALHIFCGVKGTEIGSGLDMNGNEKVAGFPEYWQKYWNMGLDIWGAGVIGEIFFRPAALFMGQLGASVFYIAILLILCIYIFDFSFFGFLRKSADGIKNGINKKKPEEKDTSKPDKKEKPVAEVVIDKKAHKEEQSESSDNIPEEYEGPEIKIYNQDQTGLAGVLNEEGKDIPKDQEPSGEDEEIRNDLDKASGEAVFMHYEYPETSLLSAPEIADNSDDIEENLNQKSKKLEETLESFGVSAKVTEISMGPTVTRFELTPKAGVKVSKITGLSKDIALNLAAKNVRIEAPIPGKSAVGIEIPNDTTNAVTLREVLEADIFQKSKSKLSVALGKDISGKPIIMDITKMPHLLIAGATGSGKSVCINTLVVSLLYKADPNEVKLVMIDPKVVELGVYNGIPHLLIPVVTDPKKAAGALNWAVAEMTDRYGKFADNNVRDIKGYNELMDLNETPEMKLPHIVIIIDELADLMMVSPADVENYICRLAQMARAAGMHLVIATQRPSVNVITGTIKANIPSRISFAVTSQIDSRTVLDMGGAEKLLGKGDMLYMPMGASSPTRLQCSYVSDKEVEAVVQYVSKDCTPNYQADIIERLQSEEVYKPEGEDPGENDEFLPQAIEMAIDNGTISTSLLQRRFRIGYNRAGSIIDQMEQRGIISGLDGNKPRKVLITRDEYNEMLTNGNV